MLTNSTQESHLCRSTVTQVVFKSLISVIVQIDKLLQIIFILPFHLLVCVLICFVVLLCLGAFLGAK